MRPWNGGIPEPQNESVDPPSEQRELAELLPDASLLEVQSENGHDGFLLDNDQIAPQLRLFLARHAAAPRARL